MTTNNELAEMGLATVDRSRALPVGVTIYGKRGAALGTIQHFTGNKSAKEIKAALNPTIPGAAPGAKVPVSVEALNGFIELCKERAGLDAASLSNVMVKLADHVHPLVLGEVHRSKSQIQMLARKLMKYHLKSNDEAIESIVKFLCSESGSHDYTIHRREALSLGLPIEKPSTELYNLIKKLYDDTEGTLSRVTAPAGAAQNPNAIQDQRQFEGWRHENA